MQRYFLRYTKGPEFEVWDVSKDETIMTSASKTECIRKLQELNGFTPVDGNEQTYVKQTGLENTKAGV